MPANLEVSNKHEIPNKWEVRSRGNTLEEKRKQNEEWRKRTKYKRKKRENPSKIEKVLIKMPCCVTPCGQTDVGSSQKTFLAFSRTSKRRH